MKNKYSHILVSGSLAYDFIMDFPGRFSDHIVTGQTHRLNLSFGIDRLEKKFGGTGGNIAFNIGSLGLRPRLLGVAGSDFAPYRTWLRTHNVDVSGVTVIPQQPTAAAYIVTDKSDNQIAAFYAGAMDSTERWTQNRLPTDALAIIAPNKAEKMISFARLFKRQGIEYIFDPGQALTSLRPPQIRTLLSGAQVVVANDYEMALLSTRLRTTLQELRKDRIIIVTRGERGSVIYVSGKTLRFPAVKVPAIDPTGAGDAYRAGLLIGLTREIGWERTGQLAATIASFAVEKYGTQEHELNKTILNRRLHKHFSWRL